jgi:hypothetical protein
MNARSLNDSQVIEVDDVFSWLTSCIFGGNGTRKSPLNMFRVRKLTLGRGPNSSSAGAAMASRSAFFSYLSRVGAG